MHFGRRGFAQIRKIITSNLLEKPNYYKGDKYFKMKLNLGCGKDIKQGYINIDKVLLNGVNIVCDIEEGLPFKDSVFDKILCDDVLEHLDNIMDVMVDIHRILKKEGIVNIEVPHCSSVSAYADPTHKSFFSYMTAEYFGSSVKFRWNYYSEVKFQIVSRRLQFSGGRMKFLNFFIDPVINLFPNLYERLFMWLLPCENIFFVLRAKR